MYSPTASAAPYPLIPSAKAPGRLKFQRPPEISAPFAVIVAI